MKKTWLENKKYNKDINFLFINPSLNFGRYVNIPIGLATLAAMLEELGFSIICKDYNVEQFNKDELFDLIKKNNINVIGFSIMTTQANAAYAMAGIIRHRFPDIKLIVGGHHATVMPEEPLKNNFNIVYTGDSEETLMESIPLLSRKENSFQELKNIAGISFIHDGNIIHNSRRQMFTDLDDLPFPARHLFPFPQKYKTQLQINKGHSAHIITSRGCIGRCFFCSNLYNSVAGRSAKNVVDEMEMLVKKYNISQIFIQDDFSSYSIERIFSICDEIQKRKLKVDWSMSNTRVESTTYEMFKRMKDVGCIGVGFGIESGSPEIRKRIGKRNNIEDVEKAVKNAKKAGLLVGGFYIFGFPFETIEDMKKTLKYAKRLNTPLATFAVFCPFPGSPSFVYLKRKNALKTYDWSQYATHGQLLFHTDNFSDEDITKFKKHAYLVYYLSPKYICSIVPLIFRNVRPYMWLSGLKFILDFISNYRFLSGPKKQEVFKSQ